MIKDETYSAFGDHMLPEILAWIRNEVKLEDIFDKEDLGKWAVDNGYLDPDKVRVTFMGETF